MLARILPEEGPKAMKALQSTVLSVSLVCGLASTVSAQFMPFGSGCAGTFGTPKLLKPAGSNLHGLTPVHVENLGPGLPTVLFLGFAGGVGIDLGVIGAPGCELYTTPFVTVPMSVTGGRGLTNLPMHVLPRCASFRVQSATIDTGANALGVVTSNPAEVVADPVARMQRYDSVPIGPQSDTTYVPHAKIDGRPGAMPFYTATWNGVNNLRTTGLWYDAGSVGKLWSIRTQDNSSFWGAHGHHVFLPNSDASQWLVTADSSNTFMNRVRIDHPDVDGNPSAILFVNQVMNPGDGPVVRNDSEVGVYYNGSTWWIYNEDTSPMPPGASFHVLLADERLAVSEAPFVHHATASNSTGNLTQIDHPALNGNPDAQLLVTTRWLGTYLPHTYDTYYASSRWHIRTQGGSTVQAGLAFHVLIGESTPRAVSAFHRATSGNILAHSTRMALADGVDDDPDRLLFVTQRWRSTSYGGQSVYNPHEVSVWYGTTPDAWYVQNTDRAPMPTDAEFFVFAPNSAATQFVVTAPPSLGFSVPIRHPSLDGNPDATPFVTHVWNPGGGVGVRNSSVVSVRYNGSHWVIANTDLSIMPAGASYNVLVPDEHLDNAIRPFKVVSGPGNTTSHILTLDHGSLNNRPDRRPQVTQSYDNGVMNPHPVGVYYANGRWRIFSQDFGHIPAGATFHVLPVDDCP